MDDMEQQGKITQRMLLRRLFEAGLEAVAPGKALLQHVSLEDGVLVADGRTYPLNPGRRVFAVGGGKGVAPMARALEDLLGPRLDAGVVVAPYGHHAALKRIALLEASHPVPDDAGCRAASTMLDLVQGAEEGDLVIALFTGGASALTPAPVQGVSLEEVQSLTRQLLRCGATIHEINALRKHLSRFSGGQLARAAAPANVLGILVSDVVGDAADVIASGPTAPDLSTYADCLTVLERYGLRTAVPTGVLHHLEAGAAGRMPETPKPADTLFQQVCNLLVASNGQALDAVARKAGSLGLEPRRLNKPLSGEAREQAAALVREAIRLAETYEPGSRPVCLLAGGETTVTIRGHGRGGRNQEMALAAALELEKYAAAPRIAALFAGTDGIDGTTEAAGGFAFADSAAVMRGQGVDPQSMLADNNSYAALKAAGELLVTGPTMTNVMDLAMLVLYP